MIFLEYWICSTWEHLFFFEFDLIPEEFFRGKVTKQQWHCFDHFQLNVTVYDANTILRDVEIGSFELDLAYIYDLPNHELYRRWTGLSDSSGKTSGVQVERSWDIYMLGILENECHRVRTRRCSSCSRGGWRGTVISEQLFFLKWKSINLKLWQSLWHNNRKWKWHITGWWWGWCKRPAVFGVTTSINQIRTSQTRSEHIQGWRLTENG